METLDLVVIGAGLYGLASAKTFHQLHPEKSLAILELAASLGGVWSEERLYPGLKTNNMLGTYELPDFPMDADAFGVKPGEHIPGTVLHNYLTKYAEKFDILDKIRCGTKVVTAEHQEESADGGWVLTVKNTAEPTSAETKMFAKKLIVATGLTSEPFLPDFAGQDSFGVPIVHGNKDFSQHHLDTAKKVTVFGGTKSAWDAVYQFATKGVKVNWVIRESGHGPVWMAPPYVTPLKKWLEKLVHTRMLTWFSPCIWGSADGYSKTRNFYHGTYAGRLIVDNFWKVLGGDVVTLNKYDSHPETAKLKPWSEPMFTASSFSIMNYSTDFLELIRTGDVVKIHVADVTSLSPKTVHLSNGTSFETDLMICATGWKHLPPLKFLPEGIDKELGIPHTPGAELLFTTEMVEKADKEILERFPRLKQQPVQNKNLVPLLEQKGVSTRDKVNPSTPLTPYTLYRFMLPPSERFIKQRDIAFAGVLMNFSVTLMAPAQALWINAFFDGRLANTVIPKSIGTSQQSGKTMEEIRYETVLYSRFGKWRYPAGYGTRFPDFVFDSIPYIDLLVGDLGLPIYRKGGMIAEATQPYGPEDYKNLVQEWKDTQGL